MATDVERLTGVARRLAAFVAERYPFALHVGPPTLEGAAKSGLQVA